MKLLTALKISPALCSEALITSWVASVPGKARLPELSAGPGLPGLLPSILWNYMIGSLLGYGYTGIRSHGRLGFLLRGKDNTDSSFDQAGHVS